MTSGIIEVGDVNNTDIYYRKSWNGGDGRLTENPYTMSSAKRFRTKSSIIGSSSPPQYYCNCAVPPPLVWNSNDQLALLGKAAEAIRGHSFNLAVAAGEGRETIQMLTNVASSFRSSIKSLKRGDGSGALRALGFTLSSSRLGRSLDTKNVSSAWLAIQYGWKPLLSDLYESTKAYEALTSAPRKSTIRVSKAIRNSGFNSSASPSNWECTASRIISRRLKIVLTEELSAPRSLGLLNPASVAWELVPFSFVADWFIPIGSYIDNMGFPPSLFHTITMSELDRWSGRFVKINNVNVYHPSGFNDEYDAVAVTRSTNVPFSPPLPRFTDFSKAMSAGRVKNAIALLHQVFL
jgi:hypothetical protein